MVLSTGFAFLLYAHEESVHHLLAACEVEGPNLFFFVSSVSTRNKKVIYAYGYKLYMHS